MRELPVLLPAECERGHAVHHDCEEYQGQVDDLHPPGGVVGKVLPFVEVPEEMIYIVRLMLLMATSISFCNAISVAASRAILIKQ